MGDIFVILINFNIPDGELEFVTDSDDYALKFTSKDEAFEYMKTLPSGDYTVFERKLNKSCLAAQSQSVEGRMYTERDMIAFGVFLGSYQNLEIEEVLDIFNKESGISEKPNNHIESLEKKLMQ